MKTKFNRAICKSISIWHIQNYFNDDEKKEVKKLIKDGYLEVTKNLIRVKI